VPRPLHSSNSQIAAEGPGPERHALLLAERDYQASLCQLDLYGYVYVPTGRFLFGGNDDELARRNLLGVQPLHEFRMGASSSSATR